MLVDLKTILADTREKHYAVGLFNCVTLEMTKGILAAAEELHSPVIIGPAESLLPGASLAEYADMMLGMARRAGVPVALHFDHGFTPELVEEAIRLGFSSVMYDCSMLPFEENVRRTREMTAKAHAAGCSLEAEIGHVGSNGSAEEAVAKTIYTQPQDALRFAAESGCDALAVAIGTAHGVSRKSPCLIWTAASPVLREHAQRRWCCMGQRAFGRRFPRLCWGASPKSTFSLAIT
ncbi:MAG: class II fructose-bisphosphate aldolase [Ruthenibacterium lactatiformans]